MSDSIFLKMVDGNTIHADIGEMYRVLGRIQNLLSHVNGYSPFVYPNPNDYGANEEYDTSSINDSKRQSIANLISNMLNDFKSNISIAEEAQAEATLRLRDYRLIKFDIPTWDDDLRDLFFVGNSLHHYEGYPMQVDKFLGDVNIDTSILSKGNLGLHERLLEAAEKGDRRGFEKILNDFIFENINDPKKQLIGYYMNNQRINDEMGSIMDMTYKQYRDSAKHSHDGVIIEGMELLGEGPNATENKEALKRIMKRDIDKNEDVVFILDCYEPTEEENKEFDKTIEKLVKELNDEGYDVNYEINRARTIYGEVTNAKYKGEPNLDKRWRNQAEDDGGVHANKLSVFAQSYATASILSDHWESEMNMDYHGDVSNYYQVDPIYGGFNRAKNNQNTTAEEKDKRQKTISGSNDKTDDFIEFSAEYYSIVPEIVDPILEKEEHKLRK